MNGKRSNDIFVRKISMFGGPSASPELFDMIPLIEKQSGIWSERTKERIKETNESADHLADALVELFAELRKNGLSLAKKPAEKASGWRPI